MINAKPSANILNLPGMAEWGLTKGDAFRKRLEAIMLHSDQTATRHYRDENERIRSAAEIDVSYHRDVDTTDASLHLTIAQNTGLESILLAHKRRENQMQAIEDDRKRLEHGWYGKQKLTNLERFYV